MANPGGAFASALKVGSRMGLVTTITATAASADIELRDVSTGIWTPPERRQSKWGISAGGKPMALDENYTITRVAPGVSFEAPLTHWGWSVFHSSVLQNNTYSVSKHQLVLTGYPSIAALFLHLAAGTSIGTNDLVYDAVGGVATEVSVDIPAVDDELGKPMVRSNFIFANGTRTTTAMGAAAVVDTAAPKLSSDFTLKVATVATSFVSWSHRIVNGAQRAGNAGVTPDVIAMGEIEASGTVVLLATNASGDPFDVLADAADAGTVVELKVYTNESTGLVATFDAKIHDPKIVEQNGLYVGTFEWSGAYIDVGSLVIESFGTDLAWD